MTDNSAVQAANPMSPVQEQASWRNYLELTKPRITSMVVLTTLVGYLAASSQFDGWLLVMTLVGTALIASGASALNQYAERHLDGRMKRTANRPLPAGRLGAGQALWFSVVLSIAGFGLLAAQVNLLTAGLGAATLLLYVFAYTPLKTRTSLATLVGAVPGAMPPMMGVAAASGQVSPIAWSLFAILFLWQMPHFLAIAWLYRSDYQAGGYPLLSVNDIPGIRTAVQVVLYSAALIPISLTPAAIGLTGSLYTVGAIFAGLLFLGYSVSFAWHRNSLTARRLLLVSVTYLPVVLMLIVFDLGG